MSEFCKKIRILAEHTNFHGQLRLKSLMSFFQEISIAHTEFLGNGREKTFDKGLSWIIIAERFKVTRLPKFDETISIITYPGSTMRFFMPKYYEIYDENNNLIIQCSSMWALIDVKKRTFADPEKYNIHFEGVTKGNELDIPLKMPVPDLNKTASGKVNFSDVDLNGHLNNTAYINKALDLIDNKYLISHDIQEVYINFRKEIKIDEEYVVKYDKIDNNFYFSNEHFTIKLTFAE
ncbi:MAG: hypothetical protein K5765_03945 [Clostridia bacterium]|nr:hypothetical protein [Clostridia bacterium]